MGHKYPRGHGIISKNCWSCIKMPAYEYNCLDCKRKFEIFLTYAEYGTKEVTCKYEYCNNVFMQKSSVNLFCSKDCGQRHRKGRLPMGMNKTSKSISNSGKSAVKTSKTTIKAKKKYTPISKPKPKENILVSTLFTSLIA